MGEGFIGVEGVIVVVEEVERVDGEGGVVVEVEVGKVEVVVGGEVVG